jgi:type II secretory pathway pseudopilin PulG
MSMAPFGAGPLSRRSERNRARLALVLAIVGIAAALLAYAVSPGVRHAVSHAAHSVNHAVVNVFDKDKSAHKTPPAPAKHAKAPAKHPRAPAKRASAGSSHTGSASTTAQHANGP